MIKVVGAYVRVSSRSQTVATQRATIEQVAKNRGDKIGRWWEETESGRKLDRPVLGAVRTAASKGELCRLYVYKLDRITRSGIRDTLSVLQEFQDAGVQLVSIADPFDLASPFAPVIVSVIAWAAEQERRVIGERISDARKRVEAQGRNWGRPEGAIPQVKLDRARTYIAEGASIAKAAKLLDVDRTTLFRTLRRSDFRVAKTCTKTEPVTPGNHLRVVNGKK